MHDNIALEYYRDQQLHDHLNADESCTTPTTCECLKLYAITGPTLQTTIVATDADTAEAQAYELHGDIIDNCNITFKEHIYG
jgi:hypothetical protein